MSIMIGGRLMPIPAQLPRPSCAKEGKKSKKYARQFKAQNTRELHEGLPYCSAELPAAAYQPLPGLPRLHR